MCRRYIKKGSDIILRREGRPTTEIVVKKCNIQGELVSLVRNFS
jgi:SOS-response transcriptional repressor LexA